jgi:hypothetical protein
MMLWGTGEPLQGLLSSLGLGISSRDMDSAHTGRLQKEKAAGRAVQRSPETGGSLLR